MTQGAARPPMVFDRAFLTGVEGVTELIFVRHGEQDVPDWNASKVGDTFDPPLSVRGQRQAGLVGERLSAEGHGQMRPVAPNDDEAGSAKNRRIEILLVPAGAKR